MLIAGAVAYYYASLQSRATYSNTLSSRSRRYIEAQKKNNNENWQGVNFESSEQNTVQTTPQSRNTTVNVDNCFSIKIPFSVWLTRRRDQCNWQWGVNTPRATIRAYMRTDTSTPSLDELSDVKMRRLFKDKYVEEKVKVNDKTFLLFEEVTDTYEKTAFHLTNGKIFVLSITTPGKFDLDKQFLQMVSSIKFKPNITFMPTSTSDAPSGEPVNTPTSTF